jgi:UDP-glucose 4-epimerase
MNKHILVLGGAGYIGSHMSHRLVDDGHDVVVFDNLSTGHMRLVPGKAKFFRGDLRNKKDIERVFEKYDIDAVMHFAAASLVGESMTDPLKYYENNVTAAVNLLQCMRAAGVNKIIFSSTAAVFGQPEILPLTETSPTTPINPYGRSKLMIEHILADSAAAWGLSYIVLRYFNACGARKDALTGEMHDPETHLIPNILKAIKSGNKALNIFGDKYQTRDGTCVRDYIHVEDLCQAHSLALAALDKGIVNQVFNLGNGNGYSVREVVDMAETVTGKKATVEIAPPRCGDPATLIAAAEKAREILGWQPKYGLEEIVRTAWVWEMNNER